MATDPRERRLQERRRALAIAFHGRFSEEGFAGATLDALAGDAGMSKQNLLFYFRDKDDLWAEAFATSAETVFPVLQRLVEGEAGSTAIRALRRAIDEVERILPAPFGILLDDMAARVASAHQRKRSIHAHGVFLDAFARALSLPKAPSLTGQRLARFTWLGLLGHHREARIHLRSGLTPKPTLAADLDWTEAQLVLLARTLLR